MTTLTQKKTQEIRLAHLEAPTKAADGLDRSAFMYMAPWSEYANEFSQCSTCKMFLGNECSVHGPEVSVTAGHSCGAYAPGKAAEGEGDHSSAAFKVEESGLVNAQTRCENCRHFNLAEFGGMGMCGLFEVLNRTGLGLWTLDPRVEQKGCCNAWQSITQSVEE